MVAGTVPSRLARITSKQIFSVTQPAAARLEQLLSSYHQSSNALSGAEQRSSPSASLRGAAAFKVNLLRKGCSGLSYHLSFINPTDVSKSDEVIKINDVITLVIDSKAVMFLIGTEMDYREEPLGSRFTFSNPNQRSSCGCGKSFTV